MLYCISRWCRGRGEVYIIPAESAEDAIKKLQDEVGWLVRVDVHRIDNLEEVTLVYEQGVEED